MTRVRPRAKTIGISASSNALNVDSCCWQSSQGTDEPRARKRFALEIARLGVRLFSGDQRIA